MPARLQVKPLDATFGAIVTGVRLAQIDDQTFSDLYSLWLEHALLVLPDQHLTRDEQIAFAKRFGPLEIELAKISNLKKDGSLRDPEDESDGVMKVLRGNEGWHADSTYMPLQAKGAVFSAVIVPQEGGATGFADMRAAYDALDPARKQQLEGLSANHSLYYSQSKVGHVVEKPGANGDYNGYGFHEGPVPRRPLIKVHPETGRKSLLIGRHAYDVTGMDRESSERFLNELLEFACQPPRVYHHQWKVGDTIIWDNRCLLHRATPWNLRQAREMWHTRLAGNEVSEAALAEAAA